MTLSDIQELTLSPDIVLSAHDHRRLTDLAHAGINMASTVADDLLYELERADVLPDDQMPSDVVRMGCGVRYRTDDGGERDLTLVFPAEADIVHGRVSVMTPIGAALIGLRQGQSITWVARTGRKQMLTVLEVRPPEEVLFDPPSVR